MYQDNKIILSSYPRSGRRWLRSMIREYFRIQKGLDSVREQKEALLPFSLKEEHVINMDSRPAEEIKRLLLLRHPMDSLISFYHRKKNYNKTFGGSQLEFVQSEQGTEKLLSFLHSAESIVDAKSTLTTTYERLHAATVTELSKVLRHCGESTINIEYAMSAVNNKNFATQQQELIDKEQLLKPSTNLIDPNELIVRSGKVNHGIHEFSTEAVEFIQTELSSKLSPPMQKLLQDLGYATAFRGR